MRLRGCPTQQSLYTRPTFWFALWVAVFLGMLAAAPTSSASAQGTSAEQEARTRLSKEELRARLQGGEMVQRAIIQGDDLIAILQERTLDPTVEIKIVRSVIEGGLNFTTLPVTAVEQVQWPRFWSDEDKEQWIARNRSYNVDKMRTVANSITIAGSTILPRPGSIVAVETHPTLFHGMNLDNTTINGVVNFGHATFSQGLSFQHTTFSQTAYFAGATFNHGALFMGATFGESQANFIGVTFRQMASFGGATFTGAAFEATFRGAANFHRVTFIGTASFTRVRFANLAFFRDTRFSRRLILEHALFETYADFRDTQIQQLAFNNVRYPQIINGRMDFRRATITEADLQDIMFGKDINFSGALFGVEVDAKVDPVVKTTRRQK